MYPRGYLSGDLAEKQQVRQLSVEMSCRASALFSKNSAGRHGGKKLNGSFFNGGLGVHCCSLPICIGTISRKMDTAVLSLGSTPLSVVRCPLSALRFGPVLAIGYWLLDWLALIGPAHWIFGNFCVARCVWRVAVCSAVPCDLQFLWAGCG
jgi:hypothetical protein